MAPRKVKIGHSLSEIKDMTTYKGKKRGRKPKPKVVSTITPEYLTMATTSTFPGKRAYGTTQTRNGVILGGLDALRQAAYERYLMSGHKSPYTSYTIEPPVEEPVVEEPVVTEEGLLPASDYYNYFRNLMGSLNNGFFRTPEYQRHVATAFKGDEEGARNFLDAVFGSLKVGRVYFDPVELRTLGRVYFDPVELRTYGSIPVRTSDTKEGARFINRAMISLSSPYYYGLSLPEGSIVTYPDWQMKALNYDHNVIQGAQRSPGSIKPLSAREEALIRDQAILELRDNVPYSAARSKDSLRGKFTEKGWASILSKILGISSPLSIGGYYLWNPQLDNQDDTESEE